MMPTISSQQNIPQIYRLKDLTQITGLSRSTIYDRLNSKSPRYDPTFPRAVSLGPRAVGWLSSEILLWIESRKASSQIEKGEK